MLPPIILASQSPRRRELLAKAGVPFSLVVRDTEELKDAAMPPQELCLHNARAKAQAVFREHPDSTVIGADTLVFWTAFLLANRKTGKRPVPCSGCSLHGRTTCARRFPSGPPWE